MSRNLSSIFARHNLLSRAPASTMAVAMLTAPLAVGVPSASAEVSSTPILLIGSTNGISIDSATFDVRLWPRDEVDRQLNDGDRVGTLPLPEDAVETTGTQFVVRLNPATIPANYLNDDGRLDLSMRVDHPNQLVTGSTFATVALVTDPNLGTPKWVDPLEPVADGEPAAAHSDLSPVQIRLNLSAQGFIPKVTGGISLLASCPNDWVYEYSSDRKVSIAHTFVPDGTSSTAWAGHAASRNVKEGVAYRGEYQGASWREESARTFESGVKFEWIKNQANTRTYRMETRYGRYKWVGTPDGENCIIYERMWKPRYNTGGYVSWSSTSDPSWLGQCAVVEAGTWTRQSSEGSSYTHSGGVLIADIIGFDMWSERGYYSNSFLAYQVVGSKRLCGYDRAPSLARHVRMRLLAG